MQIYSKQIYSYAALSSSMKKTPKSYKWKIFWNTYCFSNLLHKYLDGSPQLYYDFSKTVKNHLHFGEEFLIPLSLRWGTRLLINTYSGPILTNSRCSSVNFSYPTLFYLLSYSRMPYEQQYLISSATAFLFWDRREEKT